jgi:hypothetical protein
MYSGIHTTILIPPAIAPMSFEGPTDSAQPVKIPVVLFSPDTDDTLKKLNELAKRHPFCSPYKARKHDPL